MRTRRRTGVLYGPWKLTPREVRALDAACVYDSNGEAAQSMGVAVRTYENLLYRAYNRMDVYGKGATRVLALRLWLGYHGVIVL
jgi:DNA-binding CsgD family transcriptional regulator